MGVEKLGAEYYLPRLGVLGSFVAIVNRPETAGRWGAWRWLAAGSTTREAALLLFQLSPRHRKHNLPDQLRVGASSDRNRIA